MTGRVFTALVLVAIISSAAVAQSAQDQAACRSDAIKFCSSNVGKPDEMKQCLVKNKEKLSDTCKKLVESRGG